MDAGQGPAPPLEGKTDDSPEEKLKLFEKKVTELIEESCLAASRGELQLVSSYYCCFFLFLNFMLRYKSSHDPIIYRLHLHNGADIFDGLKLLTTFC